MRPRLAIAARRTFSARLLRSSASAASAGSAAGWRRLPRHPAHASAMSSARARPEISACAAASSPIRCERLRCLARERSVGRAQSVGQERHGLRVLHVAEQARRAPRAIGLLRGELLDHLRERGVAERDQDLRHARAHAVLAIREASAAVAGRRARRSRSAPGSPARSRDPTARRPARSPRRADRRVEREPTEPLARFAADRVGALVAVGGVAREHERRAVGVHAPLRAQEDADGDVDLVRGDVVARERRRSARAPTGCARARRCVRAISALRSAADVGPASCAAASGSHASASMSRASSPESGSPRELDAERVARAQIRGELLGAGSGEPHAVRRAPGRPRSPRTRRRARARAGDARPPRSGAAPRRRSRASRRGRVARRSRDSARRRAARHRVPSLSPAASFPRGPIGPIAGSVRKSRRLSRYLPPLSPQPELPLLR